MKGFITLPDVLGFTIVLLIYVYALYPNVIQPALASSGMATADPITTSVMGLIPAAFLVAIVVGIFRRAFGQPAMG